MSSFAAAFLSIASGCHTVAPGVDASADAMTIDDVASAVDVAAEPDVPYVAEGAIRAVAPISTEIVSSRRPTFRWVVPDGAPGVVVEVCADRECTMVQTTIASTATAAAPVSGAPTTDLTPGVHYWRVRSGTNATPVRELVVGHGHAMGHDGRSAWITDVNGDGLADVVVGASHAMNEAGRVYVYGGMAHGVAATPSSVLEGTGELAGHFGWWIAPAGDVNGDGFGDVVIAAPDVASGSGAVMIFLGSATGLPTHATSTLVAPDPSGNFGAYVAGAGDVNGDGYSDIVVGAPNVASSAGRVYVYLGSAMGIQPQAIRLDGMDGVGGTFGSAVAGVGDVNGDGFADIIAGASGANSTAGRAYLYLGAPHGPATTPSISIPSPSTQTGQFGASITSAGDVNGDGFADVLIGASGTLAGDTWLYLGTMNGLHVTPSFALASPDGPRGGFGWAVSNAGDLNGDGFDDVVVSSVCAPFHADPDGGYPTCGPGRVHVFYGAATGLPAMPSLSIDGPIGEPAAFGWSLAGVGDVDGDGFSDVVVGAEATQMFAGSIYVYRGSASGLIATPMIELTGPDGTGGNFGWSVAMRSAPMVRWAGI